MRLRVPARARRIASLASWTIIDQVLSALSNILLAILVARSVDAAGFGSFATAVLVFSLAVGITRAAIGQPLQITFAAAPPHLFAAAVRSALGSALIIGLVGGMLVAVTGLVLANESGTALVALGICLPALLVQDICRLAFFSSGKPRNAAAIDALWALLVFVALGIALAAGAHNTWLPIVIWGGGAAAAALYGFGLLHCLPRLPGAAQWAWQQRKLTGYLTAEFALSQGVAMIGILMIGVLGSQAGVGAVRAGQVLIGPLTILVAAAFMFAVPEVARRPWMTRRSKQLFSTGVSAALGIVTVVYCALLLIIPAGLGEQLFGETWSGAESVLLAMCLLGLAAALATGPVAILYSMGRSKVTFGVNLIRAPLLITLMIIGIWWSGPVGAAWALGITEALLLPLWFYRLRQALRETTTFPQHARPSDDAEPTLTAAEIDFDLVSVPAAGPKRGRHAR